MRSLMNEDLTPQQRDFVAKHSYRTPQAFGLTLWQIFCLASYIVSGFILFSLTLNPETVPQWAHNVGDFATSFSMLLITVGGFVSLVLLVSLIAVAHNEKEKVNEFAITLIPNRVRHTTDVLVNLTFTAAILFLFAGLIVSGSKWSAIYVMMTLLWTKGVYAIVYNWLVVHIKKLTPEQLQARQPIILEDGYSVNGHPPPQRSETPNTGS